MSKELQLKYISLFSGIGGFEQAIHMIFPNANCIGFSEIDPYAIKIYKHHFPDHENLGDITKIKKQFIQNLVTKNGCDLIVGGFPCTNLSSMANWRGNSKGLEGPKSGLFYDMLNILTWVKEVNPNIKFIIENNFSMKKSNRQAITEMLKEFFTIYTNMIDNSLLGVQSRKRIIWTNFPFIVPTQNECEQTWNDILEPLSEISSYFLSDRMVECLNKLSVYKNTKGWTKIAEKIKDTNRYKFKKIKSDTHKSRWDIQSRSDTMMKQLYTPYPIGKSRPITAGSGGGNNMVLDRRGGKGFIPRNFLPIEIERLFGFPDSYTKVNKISDTRRKTALGNSIPIFIAKYVIKQLK